METPFGSEDLEIRTESKKEKVEVTAHGDQ